LDRISSNHGTLVVSTADEIFVGAEGRWRRVYESVDGAVLHDLIWDGRRFIVLAQGARRSILTSTDGRSWTPSELGCSLTALSWDGS
jgi:hypothetical protein